MKEEIDNFRQEKAGFFKYYQKCMQGVKNMM